MYARNTSCFPGEVICTCEMQMPFSALQELHSKVELVPEIYSCRVRALPTVLASTPHSGSAHMCNWLSSGCGCGVTVGFLQLINLINLNLICTASAWAGAIHLKNCIVDSHFSQAGPGSSAASVPRALTSHIEFHFTSQLHFILRFTSLFCQSISPRLAQHGQRPRCC